jgi:hypothetical protein
MNHQAQEYFENNANKTTVTSHFRVGPDNGMWLAYLFPECILGKNF